MFKIVLLKECQELESQVKSKPRVKSFLELFQNATQQNHNYQQPLARTCIKIAHQMTESFNKQSLKQLQNQINLQNKSLKKFNFMTGSLKLFHQYLLKNQTQQSKTHLLSQNLIPGTVLSILNILTDSLLQKILLQFQTIINEILAFDIIKQPTKQNGLNENPIHEHNHKDQIKLENQELFHLIVYFRNGVIAQEYHQYLVRQLQAFTVIAKESIIVQVQKHTPNIRQLQYTQLHQKCFHTGLKQKNQHFIYKWIELPKCPKCLSKIQNSVSGFQQKFLSFLSQRKNQIKTCSTCSILQQYNKINQSYHLKSQHFNSPNKQTQSSSKKMSNIKQKQFSPYHRKNQIYRKLSQHKQMHCNDCKEEHDIWICMICGRMGCGRYKNADAYKHFVSTGHMLAIDLETERIWNYLGDCFSHKIVRNTLGPASQIKFPEIPSSQNQELGLSKIQQGALQAAFWQYCCIVSEQMERQRIFYEKMKQKEQEKFRQQLSNLEDIEVQLARQKQQTAQKVKKLHKQNKKLSKKDKILCQQASLERERLKEIQEYLKSENDNGLENDEDVLQKKKQIQLIQKQIEQVLAQLTA